MSTKSDKTKKGNKAINVMKLSPKEFVTKIVSDNADWRQAAAMPSQLDDEGERISSGRDAFGGRVGEGTHIVHVVLLDCHYATDGKGAMTHDMIDAECKARYGKRARAKGPTGHINTLRGMKYIESPARGYYKLTAVAVRLVEVTASRCGSDDELAALAKSKKPTKVKAGAYATVFTTSHTSHAEESDDEAEG